VLFDAMAALLQRGVDAGVFHGMDPSIQAVSYWCTLHGFAMLVLDGRMPPPRLGHLSLDELKASLLESVRRSLGH
jgi:hypothetical protein